MAEEALPIPELAGLALPLSVQVPVNSEVK
jgi:hypothetical protein